MDWNWELGIGHWECKLIISFSPSPPLPLSPSTYSLLINPIKLLVHPHKLCGVMNGLKKTASAVTHRRIHVVPYLLPSSEYRN